MHILKHSLLLALFCFIVEVRSAQAGITAEFAVTDTWSTGLNGQITITNDGPSVINSWTLEFDFPGTITSTWNGTVTSHVGTHYSVGNASYNATIGVGAKVAVGFSADPASASQPPTNFLLNGVAASGAGPQVTTVALPTASVGVAYAQTLAVSGGAAPYSWVISAGTLPAEFSLSSAGVLSGTGSVAGTSSFTVQVMDSAVPAKSATKTLTFAVAILPTITISDAAVALAASQQVGVGYLSTRGNQIVDAGGHPVRITGINWFGFETTNEIFHGLWIRGYKEALDQIKQLGFNTLRIPFSNQMLLAGAATDSINFTANPDLTGLTPLQCLDKVIAYCEVIGLRVFLDRHSSKADNFLNEDVWFIPGDAYYTEQRWIDDWVMLAQRYAGNPTVIGADLSNEPKRTATWGSSVPTTDWNKAAERCGNAILASNANWLIIVEGIEKFGGTSYWWGGNLKGVATTPVMLNISNKLVYSMHDYPASVTAQTWFSAPNYPANLGGVWDSYWGYIFKSNTAPLLLGEFGSKMTTVSDQQWMDKLTDYTDGDFDLNGTNDLAAGQKGISWTYWCFNPNSGDTGGILNDDWMTVNTTKLNYIQPSMAPLLSGGAGSVQPAVFTVTLSQASATSVTVAWATVNGSAIAGTDYTSVSGTVTFAAGETSKTITIGVLPNAAPAGTKSFTLQLSSPGGATLAGGSGSGKIFPSAGAKWNAQWFTAAQLNDPQISGDTADPNHNGRANLIEYALGQNPLGVSAAPLCGLTGGHLALTTTRNMEATDVTLIVQGSDTLTGQWTDLARSINGAAFEALLEGVVLNETVTGAVRTAEVQDIYSVGDQLHPRRFLRLRVHR